MSSDLAFSAKVSRLLLGLAPLEINDEVVYFADPQFLGATVSWNRTVTTSPFMNGGATTDRQQQMVTEQISVDVRGRTASSASLSNVQLKTNMDALVLAFLQDSYTLTVNVDGAIYEYQAEAADYGLVWQGPRFMAKLGQVNISLPRQPVPLAGVV